MQDRPGWSRRLTDMNLLDKAQAIQGEITEIRRHLHQYPELSGQEYETGDYICRKLGEWGIPFERGVADTGVVALIEGGKAEASSGTVALRADMDALPMEEITGLPFASCRPGVMHSCGHDGHTAIALGAGKLLWDMREELAGNVKLFFQPAEETTGGALRMIRQGCLESPHVSHVLGLHMDPSLPCGEVEFRHGKMMASSDEFTIRLTGRGCHGAHPEKGCDAIAMAAQIVTALQTVVSRGISPVNSAVVTVGMIHAGTAGNAIAQTAELTGIIRCLDPQTRSLLQNRVREITENTALAFGGRGELIIRPSYSALINDDAVTDTMIGVASSLLGAHHVHRMEAPDMGTEDFSFFAQERPSCFWHLGCGIPGRKVNYDIHNPAFELDENCLPTGVAVQTAGVLALLSESTATSEHL